MFIASTIGLVLRYVPEIRFGPFFDIVFSQVHVLAWIPGQDGFLDFVMLLGLACAGIVASRRVVDDFALIPGAVVVIVLVIASIAGLVRDGIQSSGLGIAVAICLMIASVQATRKLVAAQPRTDPATFPAKTVVACIVTFLPTLAVGRWLFGRDLVSIARPWDGNAWTFANISTLWLWLAGALVAILIGIAVSFVPLGQSRKRLSKVVVAVLAVASLAVYVAPTAARTSSDEAYSLSTASPADRLGSYCQYWTRTTDVGTVATLVFTGAGCGTAEIYNASMKMGSTELGYDLGQGARFGPQDGSVNVARVASAAYGGVIVVAAIQSDGAPGLVGVDISSGAALWSRFCPPTTSSVSVRFAGSSGDDPSTLRVTQPGEGMGIFLSCDGVDYVFPPMP